MTLFLRILAVILFLTGLLAGGCSLVFTSLALDGGMAPFWLAGIAICVGLIWAAIAIWRSQD